MIARMNLRENGKPRNLCAEAATNCYFNTGSITLLNRAELEFNSSTRGGVPRLVCIARNIIGYAAVVCLFAAYLRAPTIKSNRKTWMECRNDERQCIPARQRPALPSLVLHRHPGKVIETFFTTTSNMEVIEAHSGRNLLISCRLQELRK